MLKTLIAKLSKFLIRPKHNAGYQTRAYPRLGEMIIIHDSLDFGPIATTYELKHIEDFWISYDVPDACYMADSLCDEAFATDSSPGVNPARGLPMMDGFLDVAGNMYGMNSFEIDGTDTFFATGEFI